MNREFFESSSQHSSTDAAAPAAEHEHGLPSAMYSRLLMLGPGDAGALGDLLTAYPDLSPRILAVASSYMGLAAVQRAIAASRGQAAGDGPSELVIATARSYNRAHGHYVAAFNAATGHQFVGADGQLDPVAVWRWQKDHGIQHDGRVGPQTSATARAAARRSRGGARHAPAPHDAAEAPVEARAAEPEAEAPVATDDAAEAEAPAVETPVVEAPVTHAPVTHAPVTHAPVTHAPVTHAPAVEAPVAHAPQAPVVEAPVKHAPTVAAVEAPQAPVAEAPAPQAPIAAPAPTPQAATVAPAPIRQAPTAAPTSEEAPATGPDIAAAGGGGPSGEGAEASPTRAPTPQPPARVDNGGPGSLARRALAAHRTADEAFAYLVSDNDGTLDRNLADYGGVAEQRALLDAVITAGADVVHVRRAFHAYWHIALNGIAATPKQAAVDWPVASLQAIHHQLKLLPDHDARSGAWKSLSWTRKDGGATRGWWDKAGGISIGTNAWNRTDIQRANGYFDLLAGPAAAGDTRLKVQGGERFKVGDRIAVDRGKPAHDISAVKSVDGDTYELTTALAHDHTGNAVVELAAGGGLRQMNWLDYTVRHEIAHALDGGAINTRGFYALGGWGGGSFRDWAGAMGSEAWNTNDSTPINEEDRVSIGAGLSAALGEGKSPFEKFRGWDPPHPIMKYEHKGVPVIEAAIKALRQGENFYDAPTQLFAANGKRFSYSPMYSQFQYFSEKAVTDRVSNYALAAPAEWFAEAYATFYEEAGKPGITEADYGRLIRSSEQRDWLRSHVHERGQAPAGTGAAKAAGGGGGQEQDQEHGAHPDAMRRGRSSGVSGV